MSSNLGLSSFSHGPYAQITALPGQPVEGHWGSDSEYNENQENMEGKNGVVMFFVSLEWSHSDLALLKELL